MGLVSDGEIAADESRSAVEAFHPVSPLFAPASPMAVFAQATPFSIPLPRPLRKY